MEKDSCCIEDIAYLKIKTMENNFKPYDKVIVPFSGFWEPTFYAYYNIPRHTHYVMSYGGYNDDKILPYEGNEDMIGKEYKP